MHWLSSLPLSVAPWPRNLSVAVTPFVIGYCLRDVCDRLQAAAKVDEARTWMKGNAAAHANSKQIDQTNKQLHTSLRREMERAKQVFSVSPARLEFASLHGL